jgi:hypothetical protein
MNANKSRIDSDASTTEVSYEMFMTEVYMELQQKRFLEEITEQERRTTEMVKKL